MKTTISLTGVLICLFAGVSNAATITWQSKTNATGNASDVVTTGTFFDSAAARSASDVTLNGVTFNHNLGGTFSNSSDITWTGISGGGTGAAPTSWDDNYEALANSSVYTQYPNVITINISDLTKGEEYLVQLWMGYWDPANWATEFYTDAPGANSSGFLNQGSTARLSQYVVGTFTADATTQTIYAGGEALNSNGHGAGYVMPSFMLVRTIPEPSAALLGGLGMLALLRRRR